MKYRCMAALIETRRLSKGLSQKDVADHLGFGSSQFISNMERGLCSLPAKHFKKISKVLGIPTDQLVKTYLADEKVRLFKEVNLG